MGTIAPTPLGRVWASGALPAPRSGNLSPRPLADAAGRIDPARALSTRPPNSELHGDRRSQRAPCGVGTLRGALPAPCPTCRASCTARVSWERRKARMRRPDPPHRPRSSFRPPRRSFVPHRAPMENRLPRPRHARAADPPAPSVLAHDYAEHARTAPAEVVDASPAPPSRSSTRSASTPRRSRNRPRWCLVAVAATGTDCVDKAACAARGIAVCNIRGTRATPCPSTSSRSLLARRQLIPTRRRARRRMAACRAVLLLQPPDPRPRRYPARHRRRRRPRPASRPRAFGMEPVFAAHWASAPGRTALGRGARHRTMVISLHCPLTEATRGLDRPARVPRDDAPPAADQHRARRHRGRARAGAGARRGPDLRRRLRRHRRRAARTRQPADANVARPPVISTSPGPRTKLQQASPTSLSMSSKNLLAAK